jgi:hypothetical protein
MAADSLTNSINLAISAPGFGLKTYCVTQRDIEFTSEIDGELKNGHFSVNAEGSTPRILDDRPLKNLSEKYLIRENT